jgi:hypothetical protein
MGSANAWLVIAVVASALLLHSLAPAHAAPQDGEGPHGEEETKYCREQRKKCEDRCRGQDMVS